MMRTARAEDAMKDDLLALTELNIRIAEAENRGEREWLATILAPRLAFQRADEARTVDDHVAFLQKVTSGGMRTTRIIEPIELNGDPGDRTVRRRSRRPAIRQLAFVRATRGELEAAGLGQRAVDHQLIEGRNSTDEYGA
jgi:hypothetical protein